MSDDLKARIAVFIEKECNLEASIPTLFLKAIALLYACLTQIEKLEWENKLFRDRLKELDTCHPDYGVSLEAAKKRISELERENADSEASIEALNSKVKSLSAHETCGCSYDTPSDVCLHHSPIVIQLKADLEAAEKLLKLSRNAPGCCVCDEIDAYFQAKGKR